MFLQKAFESTKTTLANKRTINENDDGEDDDDGERRQKKSTNVRREDKLVTFSVHNKIYRLSHCIHLAWLAHNGHIK